MNNYSTYVEYTNRTKKLNVNGKYFLRIKKKLKNNYSI